MPQKKKRTVKKQEPVLISEPSAAQVPSSTTLLAKTDKLQSDIDNLKQQSDLIKNTNWFMLVVLFTGFISITMSFIFGTIQSFRNDESAKIELIKSIEKFNTRLDSISNTQTLPTPNIKQ